jgi:hypothetical protein
MFAKIRENIAIYIIVKRKSPESTNSTPNFSHTINPYIPDIKDATAPEAVSNWGTREYLSLV